MPVDIVSGLQLHAFRDPCIVVIAVTPVVDVICGNVVGTHCEFWQSEF
jgi:hypothetical protein